VRQKQRTRDTWLHLEAPNDRDCVHVLVNFGVSRGKNRAPKTIFKKKLYVDKEAVLVTYRRDGKIFFRDTALGKVDGFFEKDWLAVVLDEDIDVGFLKTLFQ